ncbi:holo-ACP synthase [Buchnera aphidicola]|uniref:Holo-[acyl-carrier-protein] synthase n=1 Tax=Buchnera aphidicola (Anoecia oenotherae) TaxID=1241833 RepID=A0A4D6XZ98_9GAMM|nr:holo-ACP synthase [Buchnera aphidicola]QCI19330.1 holo-ACP synthase [Buchnera aphidicola (Anoecia oenotherae)]
MSILGIGIDAVEIKRIQILVKNMKTKLAHRILSNHELKNYFLTNNTSIFLAKHFAVKEAAAKALGIGIQNGIFFNNFELYTEKLGKPKMRLLHNAKLIQKKFNIKYIHVSITKEKNYIHALVILEK